METQDPSVLRRVFVPALFCLSLVLFLATSTPYAVPGESSALLAQHAGLMPFPPMTHVLWNWIVRALAALHVGPLALLPNVLSAVCGAGCVALMALLVSRFSYNVDFELTSPAVRILAGTAAAAYAAVAVPTWYMSNRAHPVSLGVLLLLASLYFLGRYRDGARRADLYTFGLIQALAIADFSTCLAMALPLGLYVLVLMKRHRDLRPGPLLGIACCALPLALIYLVAAWQYAASPAAAWREFESFAQIVRFFPREQWMEARASLFRQGWLVTLVCTVAPWSICLYINRRGGFIEGGAGSYLLHSLILLVSVMVLFNGPASPWSSEAEILLVTPSLMGATCFGYAAGYGLALYIHFAPRFRWRPRRGVVTASVLAALIVAVAGFANAPAVSTVSARDVHAAARAIVDDLAGRRILVTQGLLDDQLLIEARDAGRPLDLVNAEKSKSVAYRRYAASLSSVNRPRGLAEVGITPMLAEWMRSEPDVEARLAMQTPPDMWLITGFQIIPRGSEYLGAHRLAALDAEAVMKERRAFWDAVAPPFRAMAGRAGPERRMALDVLAWISRVANDLGIVMENLDLGVHAEEAYRKALELDSANVVARVNLHDLYVRRGDSNRADVAWAPVVARLGGGRRLPDQSGLLNTYGHIRTQAAYERFNALWNAGGAEVPDVPELIRAIELFGQGKLDDARVIVESLVEAKPGLDRAWIVLATIGYDQRDEKTVQRCLARMRAGKKRWPQLLVIMANLALQRDDYQSAREYLEAAVLLWPANEDILEKLVGIYLRDGTKRRLEYAVRNLLFMNPDHPAANFALGRMLVETKQYDLAEEAFRKVTASVSYPMAQAQLAELLRRKGSLDEAYRCAQRAVEMNESLAEGWDALGKIYADQQKPDDAARALAKARELTPVRTPATSGSKAPAPPAEPLFSKEML
ncbi:MAG: tetratricopeptide repeat protein [bacterium]